MVLILFPAFLHSKYFFQLSLFSFFFERDQKFWSSAGVSRAALAPAASVFVNSDWTRGDKNSQQHYSGFPRQKEREKRFRQRDAESLPSGQLNHLERWEGWNRCKTERYFGLGHSKWTRLMFYLKVTLKIKALRTWWVTYYPSTQSLELFPLQLLRWDLQVQ